VVGSTPGELLRLATVACAATAPDDTPLVCASHSDELPAGAEAARSAQAAAGAAAHTPETVSEAGRPGTAWWWWLGGIAVVVVLAVAAALVLVRRRPDRTGVAEG
jgi:hypothetical protein